MSKVYIWTVYDYRRGRDYTFTSKRAALCFYYRDTTHRSYPEKRD